MTVRRKVLLITLGTMVTLASIVTLFAMEILLGNARHQEQEHTRQLVRNVISTLNDHLNNLDKVTIDYASWDDTYKFIQGQNPKLIPDNFSDAALTQNNFDLLLFANEQNRLVWSKRFDTAQGKELPLTPEAAGLLAKGSPLVAPFIDSCTTGILVLEGTPMLVATRPILRNAYQGPPKGTLLIGREIDRMTIAQFGRMIGLPVEAQILTNPAIPSDFSRARPRLSASQPITVLPRDRDLIDGYGLIPDVHGKPALMLRVTAPRTVHNQFLTSLAYFLTAFILLGLILSALVYWLTSSLILSRLERLDQFVKSIAIDEDLARRLIIPGHDEISGLAGAVGQMLERIQSSLAHRIEAEKAMLESERRLRDLVNVAPFGAMVFQLRDDGGLSLASANTSAGVILHADVESLIGSPIGGIFSGPETAQLASRLQQAVREEKSFSTEVRLGADLNDALLDLHAFHIGRDRAAVFFRDVTEQHRLEEQLRQTQKMEAIGQLAGGIAHDFNNLLTVILAYAYTLKHEPGRSPRDLYVAEMIERAGERAGELTRKLLGFARHGKFLAIPLNMNAAIQEVIALLSRTIDKNIAIDMELCDDKVSVLGDPGQVSQVFLNLAINARDAMSGGGKLTFATRVVACDPSHPPCCPELPAGRYLQVTVSDTGCGIPAHLRERIFEPFFTTKEPGKGTGMGLAMVFGIVRNHGGSVHVTSEEGRGTTFSLWFPCVEAEAVTPAHGAAIVTAKENTRIMIIDDEELTLNATAHVLTHLGYTVDPFSDPRQAIEHYRARAAQIDLVIADLSMPDLDGRECFHRLRGLNPAVRFILASGYDRTGRARQGFAEGMAAFLPKPYDLPQISRIVADALGRGETPDKDLRIGQISPPIDASARIM